MKKVTLMLALAVTLFTACHKDDDLTTNTHAEPVQQQVPAIVSMMYYLNATDDMLHFLDYTVIYDDGTGEREEAVTSNRWEKTFVASLPATFTIKKRLRVKEGMYDALVATDTVHLTQGHGYAYQIFDSTATAIHGMNDSYSYSSSLYGRGVNIAEHCEAGDFDKTYTLSFDANGARIGN
jgi:hypothetical protein